MINILLLALIACGDEEKEDTSKLEVENPQEEVVEETEEQFIVPPKTMNVQVTGVPCVEK